MALVAEIKGYTLAVMQEIAYGHSPRREDVTRAHETERKAVAELGSLGYVTTDVDSTYRATDAGRVALDALRRSNPEASPYVFYRTPERPNPAWVPSTRKAAV